MTAPISLLVCEHLFYDSTHITTGVWAFVLWQHPYHYWCMLGEFTMTSTTTGFSRDNFFFYPQEWRPLLLLLGTLSCPCIICRASILLYNDSYHHPIFHLFLPLERNTRWHILANQMRIWWVKHECIYHSLKMICLVKCSTQLHHHDYCIPSVLSTMKKCR